MNEDFLRWERLVGYCVDGFDCGFNDYNNWLVVRNRIEENGLKDVLSVDQKMHLERVDEIFKDSTIEIGKKVTYTESKYWWEFRIPKRIWKKEHNSFLNSLEGFVEEVEVFLTQPKQDERPVSEKYPELFK